jgi:hypothetical protein
LGAVVSLIAGGLIWLAFVFRLHAALIGVPLMG